MQERTITTRELPPRALKILQEQLAVSADFFQQMVKSVVLEAEETLFQRADRARDNAEQQKNMAAVAEIKRNRNAIIESAMAALPHRIASFGEAVEKKGASPKQVSLALLSKQSQDESVILEDLAARAEARATLTLFELGHRYAVLAASPVIEPAAQPFSPTVFCECLRRAVADLHLLPEHKVVIYQTFTHKFLQDAFAFYDKLNAQLCEQGILPNLRIFALKRRQDNASAQPRNGKPDAAEPKDEPTSAAPESVAPTPIEASPKIRAAAQSMAQAASPTKTPSPAIHAQAEPANAMDAGGEERYSALAQLLSERRDRTGTEVSEVGGPAPDMMNKVFSSLQQQPATVVSDAGDLRPRNIQQLRHELLTQLQYADPNGAPPSFNAEQTNAIDLMTMLFDRLSESIKSSSGNYLLSELQAPLLRVAMGDKSFFTHRAHPARNWLEKVALASAHWGPDGDQSNTEVALITRIHSMNRAINRDFDGDPAIFDGMASDLQKQLDQLVHRASVAEKRSVEASQGRERLQLARKQANALVAKRAQQFPGSSLTRTMLTHAWSDVLTLSLLRHGDNNDELLRHLKLLDVLFSSDKANLPAASVAKLCEAVEQAFVQAGMETMEAGLLAKEAVVGASAEEESPEDQAARAELMHKMEQRQAVEVEKVDEIVPAAQVAKDAQALVDTVRQIKQLSFGTWFEFDDAESGKPVQRKMAWYSPRTGHCLFVNRHGVRTHETSIEHLAQSMLADKVRVAPPEQKSSFVERALDGILTSLKKLGGKRTLQEKPA